MHNRDLTCRITSFPQKISDPLESPYIPWKFLDIQQDKVNYLLKTTSLSIHLFKKVPVLILPFLSHLGKSIRAHLMNDKRVCTSHLICCPNEDTCMHQDGTPGSQVKLLPNSPSRTGAHAARLHSADHLTR